MASLLSGLGRGGLMFVLIIWLQGIYLPRHGYSFSQTPLWAGIFMLPLTVGFLVAGPVSGWLSDRFGARPFATGGMVVAALSFLLLELLPINFDYWAFALILLLNGIGMGLFAAPNRAGIMNSLPPEQRGVGAGMSATFQNSAMVLSIGVFFTLIVLGLASSLPPRSPTAWSRRVSRTPTRPGWPRCPRCQCCSPRCSGTTRCRRCSARPSRTCPPAMPPTLTGRSFFPALISPSFSDGLSIAFDFAIAACLIAALASLLRGKRYIHEEHGQAEAQQQAVPLPAEAGAAAVPVAEARRRLRSRVSGSRGGCGPGGGSRGGCGPGGGGSRAGGGPGASRGGRPCPWRKHRTSSRGRAGHGAALTSDGAPAGPAASCGTRPRVSQDPAARLPGPGRAFPRTRPRVSQDPAAPFPGPGRASPGPGRARPGTGPGGNGAGPNFLIWPCLTG